MTSSLVGSEMCIRDRNGMECNGMESSVMEWNGMEWNAMEWNQHDCIRTVSYTHLTLPTICSV
eukprot:1469383-Prorocentrum_lima.AAC.1